MRPFCFQSESLSTSIFLKANRASSDETAQMQICFSYIHHSLIGQLYILYMCYHLHKSNCVLTFTLKFLNILTNIAVISLKFEQLGFILKHEVQMIRMK